MGRLLLLLYLLLQSYVDLISSSPVQSKKPVYSGVCPEGFYEYDKQCISDSVASCPPGSNLIGDYCIVKYAAKRSCGPGYILVGEDCVMTEESDFEKICPKGTIQDYDNKLICRRDIILEPICPKGTISYEGSCIVKVPLQYECESKPEILKYKSCESVIEIDSEPFCSKSDYVLSNDGKYCVKETILQPKCPYGYESIKGECIRKYPVVYECESTAVKIGNKCRITNRLPADIYCADGYYENNGKCEKMIEIAKICPTGYYEDASGYCVKKTKQLYICEDNFVYDPLTSKCKSLIESPAEPICDEDYELLEDKLTDHKAKCVKIVILPEVCPPGTIPVNETCMKKSHLLSDCPKGYQKSGKECRKPLKSEPLIQCPKEMEYLHEKGKCVKTLSQAAIYLCIDGIRDELTGECVQTIKTKASLVCPDGSNPDKYGKWCIQIVNYDCSEVTYKNECFDVPILQKEQYNVSYEKKVNKKTKQVCEKVAKVISKTCSEKKILKFIAVCPNGTQKNGHYCIQKVPVNTSLHCPDGTLDKGMCIKIKYKLPVVSCPPGFDQCSLHKKIGMCCSVDIMDMQYYCKDGYQQENDYCVKYFDKECPVGGCTAKSIKYAKYECSKGYNICHTNKSILFKQKSTYIMCCTKLESDPLYYCPNDYEYDSKRICVQMTDKICPLTGCSKTEYKLVQFKCQKGYSFCSDNYAKKGRKLHQYGQRECCQNSLVPGYPVCKKNLPLIDNACIESTDPTCPKNNCVIINKIKSDLGCPDGFYICNYNINLCCAANIKPAEIVCPQGFYPKDDFCVQIKEKVCPNGQCVKVVTTSAKLQCPYEFYNCNDNSKKFLHYQKNKCCRRITNTPLTQCEKGKQYDQQTCIKKLHPNYICPPGSGRTQDGKCLIKQNKY